MCKDELFLKKKKGHLWPDYCRFGCFGGGFGMYTVEKDEGVRMISPYRGGSLTQSWMWWSDALACFKMLRHFVALQCCQNKHGCIEGWLWFHQYRKPGVIVGCSIGLRGFLFVIVLLMKEHFVEIQNTASWFCHFRNCLNFLFTYFIGFQLESLQMHPHIIQVQFSPLST